MTNKQAKKRVDAEAFIDRLLESELNWIYVSERVGIKKKEERDE